MFNKTKDDDRASLSPTTLCNVLYIKMNTNNVESFDPTSSVQYWMNQKKRRPVTGVKSKGQEWFKGVFNEADDYVHTHSPIIKF